MGTRLAPDLGLALGVAGVASASVLIRLAHTPSLATAAWRLDLAAAAFLAIAAWRRSGAWGRLDPPQQRACLLSGLFLGLHFATWISSLAYTSVAVSVLLVTTNPLFVGLGSRWLLHERVERRLWIGMTLAMLGGVLVAATPAGAGSAAPNPLLGDALALAGAVFGSAYILLGRRVRPYLDNLDYVTPVYAAAAVFLTLLALGAGVPLLGYSRAQWGWLVLIAAIPQGIGHTMLNWALRYLTPTRVAVAILGEPVGAALLAWIFLGESMTALQVLGGALVLTGVYVSQTKRDEKGHNTQKGDTILNKYCVPFLSIVSPVRGSVGEGDVGLQAGGDGGHVRPRREVALDRVALLDGLRPCRAFRCRPRRCSPCRRRSGWRCRDPPDRPSGRAPSQRSRPCRR